MNFDIKTASFTSLGGQTLEWLEDLDHIRGTCKNLNKQIFGKMKLLINLIKNAVDTMISKPTLHNSCDLAPAVVAATADAPVA